MKKAIFVIAILVIALVGLTSYNGNTKETQDDRLMAELKTEVIGNPTTGGPTGKKRND